MAQSTTIKSSHLRLGKRTIFFDVKRSESNKVYLKITELRFDKDGKDKVYNSFILFPDTIQNFQNMLSDSVTAFA